MQTPTEAPLKQFHVCGCSYGNLTCPRDASPVHQLGDFFTVRDDHGNASQARGRCEEGCSVALFLLSGRGDVVCVVEALKH